jgi:hypothetical protein
MTDKKKKPKEPAKKQSPLWTYMPTFAHAPPPSPSSQQMKYQPRQITEADMQPLRIDTAWRPVQVLKWFGPARANHEYLPRLLVACAVLQGVHRILELGERLLALITIQYPRVLQMLRDEALAPKKPQLEELKGRLELARYELTQTRARAANDIDGEPQNPDGLRVMDLDILKTHCQMVVIGHELTSRRNVTGIDYGLSIAINVPNQRYVEDWLDRALGSSELHGILLFTPREYGRPIIVYDDGRLAYDPAQPLEGEDDIPDEPEQDVADEDPYGEWDSQYGNEDDLY